eukprot:GHVN01034446.1.p1 GENE.GHVN01034446.1~~GHVN01034446.1.p1  ORF type:complete len:4852 (-),score=810.53 GHVN01034446.1:797-15322(-)
MPARLWDVEVRYSRWMMQMAVLATADGLECMKEVTAMSDQPPLIEVGEGEGQRRALVKEQFGEHGAEATGEMGPLPRSTVGTNTGHPSLQSIPNSSNFNGVRKVNPLVSGKSDQSRCGVWQPGYMTCPTIVDCADPTRISFMGSQPHTSTDDVSAMRCYPPLPSTDAHLTSQRDLASQQWIPANGTGSPHGGVVIVDGYRQHCCTDEQNVEVNRLEAARKGGAYMIGSLRLWPTAHVNQTSAEVSLIQFLSLSKRVVVPGSDWATPPPNALTRIQIEVVVGETEVPVQGSVCGMMQLVAMAGAHADLAEGSGILRQHWGARPLTRRCVVSSGTQALGVNRPTQQVEEEEGSLDEMEALRLALSTFRRGEVADISFTTTKHTVSCCHESDSEQVNPSAIVMGDSERGEKEAVPFYWCGGKPGNWGLRVRLVDWFVHFNLTNPTSSTTSSSGASQTDVQRKGVMRVVSVPRWGACAGRWALPGCKVEVKLRCLANDGTPYPWASRPSGGQHLTEQLTVRFRLRRTSDQTDQTSPMVPVEINEAAQRIPVGASAVLWVWGSSLTPKFKQNDLSRMSFTPSEGSEGEGEVESFTASPPHAVVSNIQTQDKERIDEWSDECMDSSVDKLLDTINSILMATSTGGDTGTGTARKVPAYPCPSRTQSAGMGGDLGGCRRPSTPSSQFIIFADFTVSQVVLSKEEELASYGDRQQEDVSTGEGELTPTRRDFGPQANKRMPPHQIPTSPLNTGSPLPPDTCSPAQRLRSPAASVKGLASAVPSIHLSSASPQIHLTTPRIWGPDGGGDPTTFPTPVLATPLTGQPITQLQTGAGKAVSVVHSSCHSFLRMESELSWMASVVLNSLVTQSGRRKLGIALHQYYSGQALSWTPPVSTNGRSTRAKRCGCGQIPRIGPPTVMQSTDCENKTESSAVWEETGSNDRNASATRVPESGGQRPTEIPSSTGPASTPKASNQQHIGIPSDSQRHRGHSITSLPPQGHISLPPRPTKKREGVTNGPQALPPGGDGPDPAGPVDHSSATLTPSSSRRWWRRTKSTDRSPATVLTPTPCSELSPQADTSTPKHRHVVHRPVKSLSEAGAAPCSQCESKLQFDMTRQRVLAFYGTRQSHSIVSPIDTQPEMYDNSSPPILDWAVHSFELSGVVFCLIRDDAHWRLLKQQVEAHRDQFIKPIALLLSAAQTSATSFTSIGPCPPLIATVEAHGMRLAACPLVANSCIPIRSWGTGTPSPYSVGQGGSTSALAIPAGALAFNSSSSNPAYGCQYQPHILNPMKPLSCVFSSLYSPALIHKGILACCLSTPLNKLWGNEWSRLEAVSAAYGCLAREGVRMNSSNDSNRDRRGEFSKVMDMIVKVKDGKITEMERLEFGDLDGVRFTFTTASTSARGNAMKQKILRGHSVRKLIKLCAESDLSSRDGGSQSGRARSPSSAAVRVSEVMMMGLPCWIADHSTRSRRERSFDLFVCPSIMRFNRFTSLGPHSPHSSSPAVTALLSDLITTLTTPDILAPPRPPTSPNLASPPPNAAAIFNSEGCMGLQRTLTSMRLNSPHTLWVMWSLLDKHAGKEEAANAIPVISTTSLVSINRFSTPSSLSPLKRLLRRSIAAILVAAAAKKVIDQIASHDGHDDDGWHNASSVVFDVVMGHTDKDDERHTMSRETISFFIRLSLWASQLQVSQFDEDVRQGMKDTTVDEVIHMVTIKFPGVAGEDRRLLQLENFLSVQLGGYSGPLLSVPAPTSLVEVASLAVSADAVHRNTIVLLAACTTSTRSSLHFAQAHCDGLCVFQDSLAHLPPFGDSSGGVGFKYLHPLPVQLSDSSLGLSTVSAIGLLPDSMGWHPSFPARVLNRLYPFIPLRLKRQIVELNSILHVVFPPELILSSNNNQGSNSMGLKSARVPVQPLTSRVGFNATSMDTHRAFVSSRNTASEFYSKSTPVMNSVTPQLRYEVARVMVLTLTELFFSFDAWDGFIPASLMTSRGVSIELPMPVEETGRSTAINEEFHNWTCEPCEGEMMKQSANTSANGSANGLSVNVSFSTGVSEARAGCEGVLWEWTKHLTPTITNAFTKRQENWVQMKMVLDQTMEPIFSLLHESTPSTATGTGTLSSSSGVAMGVSISILKGYTALQSGQLVETWSQYSRALADLLNAPVADLPEPTIALYLCWILSLITYRMADGYNEAHAHILSNLSNLSRYLRLIQNGTLPCPFAFGPPLDPPGTSEFKPSHLLMGLSNTNSHSSIQPNNLQSTIVALDASERAPTARHLSVCNAHTMSPAVTVSCSDDVTGRLVYTEVGDSTTSISNRLSNSHQQQLRQMATPRIMVRPTPRQVSVSATTGMEEIVEISLNQQAEERVRPFSAFSLQTKKPVISPTTTPIAATGRPHLTSMNASHAPIASSINPRDMTQPSPTPSLGKAVASWLSSSSSVTLTSPSPSPSYFTSPPLGTSLQTPLSDTHLNQPSPTPPPMGITSTHLPSDGRPLRHAHRRSSLPHSHSNRDWALGGSPNSPNSPSNYIPAPVKISRRETRETDSPASTPRRWSLEVPPGMTVMTPTELLSSRGRRPLDATNDPFSTTSIPRLWPFKKLSPEETKSISQLLLWNHSMASRPNYGSEVDDVVTVVSRYPAYVCSSCGTQRVKPTKSYSKRHNWKVEGRGTLCSPHLLTEWLIAVHPLNHLPLISPTCAFDVSPIKYRDKSKRGYTASLPLFFERLTTSPPRGSSCVTLFSSLNPTRPVEKESLSPASSSLFSMGLNTAGALGVGLASSHRYTETQCFVRPELAFENELLKGLGVDVWWAPQPQKVVTLNDASVFALGCGENHCLALTSQGWLFSWGSNQFGQCGVVSLASESLTDSSDLTSHTIRLTRLSGAQRHISDGPRGGAMLKLMKVDEILNGEVKGEGAVKSRTAVASPMAYSHLKDVFIPALMAYHQRGISNKTKVKRGSVPLSKGAGEDHHFDSDFLLPISLALPVPVATPIRFTQICCGSNFSTAVTGEGELYLWGLGVDGCLGTGTFDNLLRPTPINWKLVQRFHSDRRREWEWVVENCSTPVGGGDTLRFEKNASINGSRTGALLGSDTKNSTTGNTAPSKGEEEEGVVRIKKVSCGAMHVAAVSTWGELWVWGRGSAAQLGLPLAYVQDMGDAVKSFMSEGEMSNSLASKKLGDEALSPQRAHLPATPGYLSFRSPRPRSSPQRYTGMKVPISLSPPETHRLRTQNNRSEVSTTDASQETLPKVDTGSTTGKCVVAKSVDANKNQVDISERFSDCLPLPHLVRLYMHSTAVDTSGFTTTPTYLAHSTPNVSTNTLSDDLTGKDRRTDVGRAESEANDGLGALMAQLTEVGCLRALQQRPDWFSSRVDSMGVNKCVGCGASRTGGEPSSYLTLTVPQLVKPFISVDDFNEVSNLTGGEVYWSDVECGEAHTLALGRPCDACLRQDKNKPGPCDGIHKCKLCGITSSAECEGGWVWGWGHSSFGQLGLGRGNGCGQQGETHVVDLFDDEVMGLVSEVLMRVDTDVDLTGAQHKRISLPVPLTKQGLPLLTCEDSGEYQCRVTPVRVPAPLTAVLVQQAILQSASRVIVEPPINHDVALVRDPPTALWASALFAGGTASAALLTPTRRGLVMWGSNAGGKLGHKIKQEDLSVPSLLPWPLTPLCVSWPIKAVKFSLLNSIVLTTTGDAFSIGKDQKGETGQLATFVPRLWSSQAAHGRHHRDRHINSLGLFTTPICNSQLSNGLVDQVLRLIERRAATDTVTPSRKDTLSAEQKLKYLFTEYISPKDVSKGLGDTGSELKSPAHDSTQCGGVVGLVDVMRRVDDTDASESNLKISQVASGAQHTLLLTVRDTNSHKAGTRRSGTNTHRWCESVEVMQSQHLIAHCSAVLNYVLTNQPKELWASNGDNKLGSIERQQDQPSSRRRHSLNVRELGLDLQKRLSDHKGVGESVAKSLALQVGKLTEGLTGILDNRATGQSEAVTPINAGESLTVPVGSPFQSSTPSPLGLDQLSPQRTSDQRFSSGMSPPTTYGSNKGRGILERSPNLQLEQMPKVSPTHKNNLTQDELDELYRGIAPRCETLNQFVTVTPSPRFGGLSALLTSLDSPSPLRAIEHPSTPPLSHFRASPRNYVDGHPSSATTQRAPVSPALAHPAETLPAPVDPHAFIHRHEMAAAAATRGRGRRRIAGRGTTRQLSLHTGTTVTHSSSSASSSYWSTEDGELRRRSSSSYAQTHNQSPNEPSDSYCGDEDYSDSQYDDYGDGEYDESQMSYECGDADSDTAEAISQLIQQMTDDPLQTERDDRVPTPQTQDNPHTNRSSGQVMNTGSPMWRRRHQASFPTKRSTRTRRSDSLVARGTSQVPPCMMTLPEFSSGSPGQQPHPYTVMMDNEMAETHNQCYLAPQTGNPYTGMQASPVDAQFAVLPNPDVYNAQPQFVPSRFDPTVNSCYPAPYHSEINVAPMSMPVVGNNDSSVSYEVDVDGIQHPTSVSDISMLVSPQFSYDYSGVNTHQEFIAGPNMQQQMMMGVPVPPQGQGHIPQPMGIGIGGFSSSSESIFETIPITQTEVNPVAGPSSIGLGMVHGSQPGQYEDGYRYTHAHYSAEMFNIGSPNLLPPSMSTLAHPTPGTDSILHMSSAEPHEGETINMPIPPFPIPENPISHINTYGRGNYAAQSPSRQGQQPPVLVRSGSQLESPEAGGSMQPSRLRLKRAGSEKNLVMPANLPGATRRTQAPLPKITPFKSSSREQPQTRVDAHYDDDSPRYTRTAVHLPALERSASLDISLPTPPVNEPLVMNASREAPSHGIPTLPSLHPQPRCASKHDSHHKSRNEIRSGHRAYVAIPNSTDDDNVGVHKNQCDEDYGAQEDE